MSSKVTAVIPAFNEGPRVGAVVSAVVAAGYDVLVVDDGSKDDTAQAAERAGARVLVLPQNGGKGNAMRAGVAACEDSDVILFLDGDMKGFDSASLHAISDPVADGRYDQVSGVSSEATDITQHVLILSGQRAIRKRFLDLLPDQAWDGYGIEVWLNDVVERHGGQSAVFRLANVRAPYKWEKDGAQIGLARMADMGAEVIKAMQRIVTHYQARSKHAARVGDDEGGDVVYYGAPTPQTLEAKCNSTECVADALTESAARAMWTPETRAEFSDKISREMAKPLWVGAGCVSYLLVGPLGPVAAGAAWLLTACSKISPRRLPR